MSRVSVVDIANLRNSGTFDEQWYLDTYPDVGASGIDPAEHYLWIGGKLGRGKAPAWIAGKAPHEVESHEEAPVAAHQDDRSYAGWLRRYDFNLSRDGEAARQYAASLGSQPLISIIMPTYNTPIGFLREALISVIGQIYQNWEICIADDFSPNDEVRRTISEFVRHDPRVRYVFREQNGNISDASNSAIAIARGEWLAFLDHDDILHPHALLMVADCINKYPDTRIIYSDEDKITLNGNRDGPYFKCDWNKELFRSHNLITHLAVYERTLINRVGGLNKEFDGAQDYDFALRCTEHIMPGQIRHLPFVLYSWRMLPGSTALSADEKPYAMLAGERALNAHFARVAVNAKADLTGFGFRIHYNMPDPPPLASIVIPTRNGLELVKTCVESIRTKSTYQRYEIILVDNGSDDPSALAYFAQIARDYGVRVVRDDGPFNYSAINNGAVAHCRGDVIVLLNNDIEVISPDWLETIIGLAIQPDVGAVGAKLLYPNGTIQHGGVVMGLGGLAAHAHTGFPSDSPGHAGRLALANEFSAVTAACMAVRKSTFLAIGGLNATDLAIAYNDVDFCLRLNKRGLRNVYTPYAVLFHHESATRGPENETPEKIARFQREQSYMIEHWRSVIDYDPAYSPNLSWDNCNFDHAFPPRVHFPWRTQ